jgi:hypothetical protein
MHYFFISLGHFSKKAEEKITYARYRDIMINEVRELEVSDEFREYVLFRLNYLGAENFFNYSYFLNAESASSLIDRYLL